MTVENDEHVKRLVAAGVLNEMNCPDMLEERAEILARYLAVVQEGAQDPTNPTRIVQVPVVRVSGGDGTPRTIPAMDGSGNQVPFPISRLVEELTAATISVRPGVLTCKEPRLRWKV